MIVQFFMKIMFLDIKLKFFIYLGCLFGLSTLEDYVAVPKSYFSRKDNLFNVYFVKIGWLWTLSFTALFLTVTSYIMCCGNKRELLENHLPRIGIATFFWYFWTQMFDLIGVHNGRCLTEGFPSKSSCLKAGHIWKTLDISGHTFILIFSSLVLIEEARPIHKWGKIEQYVLSELQNRDTSQESEEQPLKHLTRNQLEQLKNSYENLTPLVYALFIGMSSLQILWDLMLLCTMIYFHSLIEKVLGGAIAIHSWHFMYRFWYASGLKPVSPGYGYFVF